MNAQTPGSNALERRNALLRAIGLASFLMILTGFGVSLYPTAKTYGLLGNEQSCLANRDSFLALKEQRDTLISLLKTIESRYDEIMTTDGEWESAKTNKDKSELKRSIVSMEGGFSNLAERINNLKNNYLARHCFNAYDDLLVARGMIWEERSKVKDQPDPDVPGGGGANQEIVMLRMEARDVANDIDREARELENIVLKGIFWGKDKRDAKKRLENAISQLRSLAIKLRTI